MLVSNSLLIANCELLNFRARSSKCKNEKQSLRSRSKTFEEPPVHRHRIRPRTVAPSQPVASEKNRVEPLMQLAGCQLFLHAGSVTQPPSVTIKFNGNHHRVAAKKVSKVQRSRSATSVHGFVMRVLLPRFAAQSMPSTIVRSSRGAVHPAEDRHPRILRARHLQSQRQLRETIALCLCREDCPVQCGRRRAG